MMAGGCAARRLPGISCGIPKGDSRQHPNVSPHQLHLPPTPFRGTGPWAGKELGENTSLMLSKYETERYPTATSQPPSREHLLQRQEPRQHPRVAVPVAVPAWEGGSSQHCFLLH